MKELETGKDKIQKICDILKKETLDPAKEQAARMIYDAEQKATAIVKKAEEEAKALLKQAQTNNANEKKIFEKQLAQALKQSKELLRQEIEQKLFTIGLHDWLAKEGADPKLASRMIEALIEGVQKEGINANFSALIGKTASVAEVNAGLVDAILKRLQNQSVTVGDFAGGVQLKLIDHKITLDMSDLALKELLGSLLRKEFRELLFQDT